MSPFVIFVLGVLALGGLIGFASWFATASPNRLARIIKWGVVGLVAGLAIVLVMFNPRLLPIAALVGLPFLFFRMGWFGRRPARGPTGAGGTGDQASRVETAYLRMSLDRASGAMSGEVLRGRFVGRRLDNLELDDLVGLRAECGRADPQSVPLIEAYLDRRFGPDWRDHEGEARAEGSEQRSEPSREHGSALTRAEALEILGLEDGADRGAVISAWRRLIKLAHPDHGGSKYLAAKLNEAKRVLLGD